MNREWKATGWILIAVMAVLIFGSMKLASNYPDAECWQRYAAEKHDPEGLWNWTISKEAFQQPVQVVCAPPDHHIVNSEGFGPYKILDYMVRHGWDREKAHMHLVKSGLIKTGAEQEITVKPVITTIN